MQFVSTFDIPLPIDEAWELLGDIPAIAPCLPGASVRPLSDDTYEGDVSMRVGPIKAAYTGTATVARRDEAEHIMVIDAKGREGSGKGSAAAVITLHLSSASDVVTKAEVTTDLTITGRLAQFGRSALADVSQRLMDEFAGNLARQALGATPGAAAVSGSTSPVEAPAPGAAQSTQAPANELNALALAVPLLRRAAPTAAAGILGLLIGALWVKLRSKSEGPSSASASMPVPPWMYGLGHNGQWPTVPPQA